LLTDRDEISNLIEGHSREPKNVPFIYRLKLYALYIYGENETALYRQWFGPDLITLYFDEPDHVGHGSGPDSLEVCKLCFI
jgi:predicted AlkP superfamily pyrophosphatase or phosphodiesterase